MQFDIIIIVIIISVGIIIQFTALLITWLISLSSFVSYILANLPYWCTLSNLGMWHMCGI